MLYEVITDFGTIPPGGNMSVEISLNTAQLIGGNYNAVIDVSGTVGGNAKIQACEVNIGAQTHRHSNINVTEVRNNFV